jgi:hypothetical protein
MSVTIAKAKHGSRGPPDHPRPPQTPSQAVDRAAGRQRGTRGFHKFEVENKRSIPVSDVGMHRFPCSATSREILTYVKYFSCSTTQTCVGIQRTALRRVLPNAGI